MHGGESCTAVGYYQVNSSEYGLVERWNGSVWAIQPIPEQLIAQQPLTGGPITPPEEPFGNGCFACAQAEMAQAGQVGEPVNPEFGDLDESATDVTVPGRGLPLAFVRTY